MTSFYVFTFYALTLYFSNGTDNLCEPTSADSKNPESAVLILKTMPSCPGLTPTLHSTISLTAGSVEHSPLYQWKASRGGHFRFKESTFFHVCKYLRQQQSYVMPLLHLMTSNNPQMDWYNTLHFNYGHNVTCFNDCFALHLDLCDWICF